MDFTTTAPHMRVGDAADIDLTVTFEPSQTQSCFRIFVVDDDQLEILLKTVTFSYLSSSPIVNVMSLIHEVFILDNDRELNVYIYNIIVLEISLICLYISVVNCMADAGNGSRVCVDRMALSVTCLDPVLVCDYQVANCPDKSDELNCPCEYLHCGIPTLHTLASIQGRGKKSGLVHTVYARD